MLTDKENQQSSGELAGNEDISDADFVNRFVVNAPKIDLDKSEAEEISLPRVEFKGGNSGIIEFEIADVAFSCSFSKFDNTFSANQSDQSGSEKDRVVSMMLLNSSLSEAQRDDLYRLEEATITSKETGEKQDLLVGAKYFMILFSGTESSRSSGFSVLSKILLLRKHPNSLAGVLSLMHEIGHSATITGMPKTREAMQAVRGVRGKIDRENLERNIRIYAQNEVDASNHAYNKMTGASKDAELRSLSKKYLEFCLSSHIERLKNIYEKSKK